MKIQKTLMLSYLVLLHVVPGFSQTQINGLVEYDAISYTKNDDEQKINGRNQAILQLKLSSEFSERVSGSSTVEFREDQADPSRNRIWLDEAYIDFFPDNFDFRFGKQIIIWGKTDAFNPTDNITPWDFSDVLDTDDERIGVVALKASYYMGNWTLEGILVPTFTPSSWPSPDSRWFLDFPREVPNPLYPAAGPPTFNAVYEMSNSVQPDESLDAAQVAGKLSSTLAGWDMSVSYYYGWDDLPTLHQTSLMDRDSLTIRIQPEYHRLHIVGADFATTFGKIGIRGESAYYLTDDPDGEEPEVDDPYFRYVLGVDRTFSNLIDDNNVMVLVQWIHEFGEDSIETGSLAHLFEKAITARVEYELSDFMKLALDGIYNIGQKDYYLHPSLSYSVADGLQLDVVGDILGGEKGTFFGGYRENKRMQAKVKYSF